MLRYKFLGCVHLLNFRQRRTFCRIGFFLDRHTLPSIGVAEKPSVDELFADIDEVDDAPATASSTVESEFLTLEGAVEESESEPSPRKNEQTSFFNAQDVDLVDEDWEPAQGAAALQRRYVMPSSLAPKGINESDIESLERAAVGSTMPSSNR